LAMIRTWGMVAALGLVAGCSSAGNTREAPLAPPPGFKEVEFAAADGRRVYADFYPASPQSSKRMILMFHQAGSNAGEYETIAPQMTKLGFNCVAVDQRSGGGMWGRTNRTVDQSGSGEYLDAYKDLEGALKYAQTEQYSPVIVWGSSYSASLVLRLASEHREIKAVISFSPGEYMDDKSIVAKWASKLTQPTFFACTPEELTDGRQRLFNAIPAKNKVLVSLPDGVHGSSTLIPDKSKAAGQYMQRLKAFLTALKE